MKNRNVGFLVVGISLLIGIVILLFNSALKHVVDESCTHGADCAMHYTIAAQTNLSLIIAAFVLFVGLFLVFSKEDERVVVRQVRVKERPKRVSLKGLDEDEKKVIKILRREKGAFFQKSVMEELGIGKVKMTRLIDRLESKGIVERKRRGMNNILVLVR